MGTPPLRGELMVLQQGGVHLFQGEYSPYGAAGPNLYATKQVKNINLFITKLVRPWYMGNTKMRVIVEGEGIHINSRASKFHSYAVFLQ